MDQIQQSTNVKQLSNDLQNIQRGIGAGVQARTQGKALEESNKFIQQGLQQGAFLTASNFKTLLAGEESYSLVSFEHVLMNYSSDEPTKRCRDFRRPGP